MKKAPYRILLTTSDKYIWAVLPYAWLLKRYWPNHPEVVVGGFSSPPFEMPPGFSFHSIGRMEDYPVSRWSDGLIKFITDVGDDVFILTLEDMWIVQPVQAEVVNMCYDYMRQFEYVARLDLTGDRLNAGDASLYGKLGIYDLIWSNPDGSYHLSTMPAFWRKQHLLRALRPNESPWQTEIDGTPRLGAMRHEVIVLGTNAWPLRNTLAFRAQSGSQLLLDEVDPEDVTEMRKYGLLKHLEKNE